MALNENLNVKFAAADEAAIDAAIDNITTVITTTVPDPLNLSKEERKARAISDVRLPFALRAIKTFGPSFPAFHSIAVPFAKADTNFEFFAQLTHVETRLTELLDRVTDLRINAGYLAMKYTDDQYGNAKNYRTENVPGADTIYDAQFPLYDREENPGAAGGGGTP